MDLDTESTPHAARSRDASPTRMRPFSDHPFLVSRLYYLCLVTHTSDGRSLHLYLYRRSRDDGDRVGKDDSLTDASGALFLNAVATMGGAGRHGLGSRGAMLRGSCGGGGDVRTDGGGRGCDNATESCLDGETARLVLVSLLGPVVRLGSVPPESVPLLQSADTPWTFRRQARLLQTRPMSGSG